MKKHDQYLFTGLLLLFFSITNIQAHQARAENSINNFVTSKISKHIYIIHGPQTFPSKKNQGFTNNPAFIVADKGIIVIDPGSSVFIGRELLKKIGAISKKPVIAVFNTHIHGDHWLGNQAIKDKFPNAIIYGHQNMIRQINKGAGTEWIDLMNRITENSTKGTRAVAPDKALQGGEILEFGAISLKVHHVEKAHTDTDIMLEVNPDKVFFFGDIVTREQISTARPKDGDIQGQMKAIRLALKTDSTLFVPGHGKSGDRKYVEEYLVFLEKLYQLVKLHFDKGEQDYEMKPKIMRALKHYKNWHNFNEIGRVINHLFVTLENQSI